MGMSDTFKFNHHLQSFTANTYNAWACAAKPNKELIKNELKTITKDATL